jgi:THO complex subunit 4
MVNGRPRKTQEELDAEMEDYWGNAGGGGGGGNANHTATAATTNGAAPQPAAKSAVHVSAPGYDDDIDMIE